MPISTPPFWPRYSHESEHRLAYSRVPIRRAGPIQQAGRRFQKIIKDEQALLSKQAGNSKNEQALHIMQAGRKF